MGIKNLHTFLRKMLKAQNKFKDVYKEMHFSKFAGKTIAVDVSIYLYKYMYALEDKWLNGFVTFINMLHKYQIKPLMIFDGEYLPAKKIEHIKRKENKKKNLNKITQLEKLYDEYINNSICDAVLINFYKKNGGTLTPLLRKNETISIDKNILFNMIQQKKKKSIKITPKHYENLKELFSLYNIQYYTAKYEAESLCAGLCNSDIVYSVISEDTDLLCYGINIFMCKINVFKETCIVIDIKCLLESLDMCFDEFRDFCIMCGTDYNNNIPRVGPVKAFKLIKTYKSIENISKETNMDTSILNYNICIHIFNNEENTKYIDSITIKAKTDIEDIDKGKINEFFMKKCINI